MKNNTPVTWSFWGHEPLRHLRRMGNDGSSIFSLGDWAEDWYNHIHTEEMIKKAAEAGVNTIYTHYFKGFGLETEKEEIENTRLLCERAAKYGIKVLGYCQMGSLNFETLMDEIPDTQGIAIKGEDGLPLDWYGEYYRWIPCFNKRVWIDYMKKVITYGLEHVGLSGFHFDNSYNYACFCDDCTKAFRDFMTENVKDPEKIGFRHFNNLRIPKHSADPESHDPIYLWWLKYKVELATRVRNEIFDHVKKVKKDAIVLHNPGFPHWGPDFTKRGFDPSRVDPDNCDFIFAEGSSHIAYENDKIEGCVDAFKFGERFGYKVFDTSWELTPERKFTWPTKEPAAARAMAQSMVYGGICGAPYTARSIKDGHKNVLEDTHIAGFIDKYFHYFKDNYEFYNLPSENNVKILYVTESCLASAKYGMNLIRACSRDLVTEGIPYSFITTEELKTLPAGQTVIIPALSYAEEEIMNVLKDAGARGVKLLVLGELGRFHSDGKERDRHHWIHTMGSSEGFYRLGESASSDGQSGGNGNRGQEFGGDGSNIKISDEFIKILRKLSSDYAITRDVSGVLVETRKKSDNETMLHLINSKDEAIDEVNVKTYFDIKELGEFVAPDNDIKIELVDKNTVKVSNLRSVVSVVLRRG